MAERKTINTTVDKSLMKRIRLLAVERDCKINDLIEEGLKLVLNEDIKKKYFK